MVVGYCNSISLHSLNYYFDLVLVLLGLLGVVF